MPYYNKKYDTTTLEPEYSCHVKNIALEQLHAASDVAAELAKRDKRIEEYRLALKLVLDEIRQVDYYNLDDTIRYHLDSLLIPSKQ